MLYSVSLCYSVYCLCVNVYCTTASGCQRNYSLTNISYHITTSNILVHCVCLCVNVYCTTASGCQRNCSLTNISYHITINILLHCVCLCVNVYCNTASGCQHAVNKIYIKYMIFHLSFLAFHLCCCHYFFFFFLSPLIYLVPSFLVVLIPSFISLLYPTVLSLFSSPFHSHTLHTQTVCHVSQSLSSLIHVFLSQHKSNLLVLKSIHRFYTSHL